MDSSSTSPLRITAWADAVIDRIGHLPTSASFEWVWLPRVGPSTAWAYRRLSEGLSTQPDGFTVELDTLAAWLGLSGTGHQAPLMRSLRRLVRFHLALQLDDHTLAVRRRVPPLTAPQLRNLHPTLQRAHLRMVNTTPAPPGATTTTAAAAG